MPAKGPEECRMCRRHVAPTDIKPLRTHGAGAGVADKLSRVQQCQSRASSVQDVLELLVDNRTSSCSASSGAAAASAAAASAASSSAAAVALRGCVGTVKSLVKAMEASKKDMFQAWQVRRLRVQTLLGSNTHLIARGSGHMP